MINAPEVSNVIPQVGLSLNEWFGRLAQNKNKLKDLKQVCVNQVPYSILQKGFNHIQIHWGEWEPHIRLLRPLAIKSAASLMQILNHKDNDVKLFEVLSIAKKISRHLFKHYFKHCENCEQLRLAADEDSSNGLLRDIHPTTIQRLSNILLNSDWRLFGDGLGFDNLTLLQFENPAKMLDQLSERNCNVTVKRLIYEARKLELNEVVQFLSAIPLEKTPQKVLTNFNYECRTLTRFDLIKIKEIANRLGISINWIDLVQNHFCIKEIETDPTLVFEFVEGYGHVSDILWLTTNTKLTELLVHLSFDQKTDPIVVEFRKQLLDGSILNISPGGVTSAQVDYLSQAAQRLRNLNNLEKNERPLTNNQSMDGIDLTQLEDSIDFIHINTTPTLNDFIQILWQQSPKLDLFEFVKKCISVFSKNEGCRAKDLCDLLKQCYSEIKAYRMYNPKLDDLDHAYLEKQQKETELNHLVQKIHKIGLEKLPVKDKTIPIEEPKTCGICMERPINAVVIPCGHLGYCLECLKLVKTCPSCRTPMQNFIQVFPT